MAEALGYTCDVCDKFEQVTRNGSTKPPLPKGWITIIPSTGNDSDRDTQKAKQVCGDMCAAEFHIRRHESTTGKQFQRSRKLLEQWKAGGSINGK